MPPAPTPDNEVDRLAALRRYRVLDTPPEVGFDDLAAAAAAVCGTPVAVVSLIDERRQWFKARVGTDLVETCRAQSFCAHAVASGETVVAEDAAEDERFADNPLVVGPPGVRFYAGAPLVDADGFALGALCVIDVRPRELTGAQLGVLRGLARQVVAQLALRRHADDLASQAAELRSAEARLRHESRHDALTGLPNRVLLAERLTERLGRRGDGGAFALLYLDLDRFKTINDSLGHGAGDRLLVGVADSLREAAGDGAAPGEASGGSGRPRVTVARMGGDEFCVLIESPGDAVSAAGDVVDVAERVRAAVARPVDFGGRALVCAASIGVVVGPGEYRSAADVIRDADLAMYRAKASGGDRVAAADPASHRRAMEAIDLECDLRAVLEPAGPSAAAGHLVLHYQPIVSAGDGAAIGFEALVRWQHPARGLVPPNLIVPLAEQTGLIGPLGDWVLRTACGQLARWRAEFDPRLTMSVNVSGRQLDAPSFAASAASAVAASGVPATAVTLELTETAAAEAAGAVLEDLRSFGLRAVMDDFGTGYSSLSALRRLPLDGLKLDRSFTELSPDAGERSRDEAMIRAAVTLADGTGLSLVAEGVETASQAEWLRGLGCRRFQGYFYARPLTAEAAGAYLDSRRLSAAA